MARKTKAKLSYKILSVVLIVLGIAGLSGLAGYSLATKKITDSWNNKIYSGVTIKGIELSGKTKEEAVSILNDKIADNLSTKQINFVIDNHKHTYTYGDINGYYNVEETVDKAIEYGKVNNLFKKYSLIKNKNKEIHDIDLKFEYDEEKVDNIKDNLYNECFTAAKNASVTIDSGKVNITNEVIGHEIDKEELNIKVSDFLEDNSGKEVNIKLDTKITQPDITKEDLSQITGKMSTYSTIYAVGDRGKNLEIATSLINGTLLMPGDTFSYDEVSQKGRGQYTFAGGYVNGKVEQVEAGGICQVCTALYRAVMRANIRSVERHNHMMPVGYSELGLDATVAWGYLDYKFKNTYDFPIYIEGIGGGGTVTFNVYGNVSALNGNTYELVAENLGVDAAGNSKAKSYQVTYNNGVEVNREFIATDTYKPAVH